MKTVGPLALLGRLAALLLALALGCGGQVGQDREPSPGVDAGQRSSDAQGTSGCREVPSPPTIDYERTCGAYVPSLGPTEVTFVESKPAQTPKGLMIAHRFRATQACGFDAVISMPNLTFAADALPYELRIWWMNASGAVSILAGLLLRPGSDAVLLAVSPSAVDRLNDLALPLALTLSGSACADDAGGLLEQILTRDTKPLSCTDEAGSPGLRRCPDGARTYRMVAYAGTPDDLMPGLFGAAELLASAP